MATLLLVVIFIAYIGLGIPDSLFGAAWPAIYMDLGVPVSYASFVTSLVSCGTIASSFVSARIIHRFGTAWVTAVSTAMTAASLLGFALSHHMVWLCLFAVPLGLGAGAVDTALNNYVALHYSASHMSFLHCFYGVGVSISPYLMSAALRGNNDWNRGYRIMFCVQLAITAVMFFSMPLWKKVKWQEKQQTGAAQPEERVAPLGEMLKNPTLRRSVWVFVGSCGIEAICMGWGSTFLVNAKGASPDEAAGLITLYFVGLTIGRFASGLLSGRLSPMRIILAGEGVTLAAVALVLFSTTPASAAAGLFLIGLGNGPVFPNMTYLAPIFFGAECSQSYISFQMSASYVSILLTPIVVGLMMENMGMHCFVYALIAAFALTLTAILLTRKTQKGVQP